VRVIYNPIVTDELLAMSRAPVDHPWCAAGAPPVILAVGRLTEQKDFPNLIRAYARLRQRRSVRLVILGEGEARGELEDLIARLGLAEDVYLPGFVDNPFAWMRQARLFALSSRWEGLPSVLIQAMACGAQVVSTDCPSGPAEILEDGRWGRLVPVGDPEALAAAMDAALDDDEDIRAAVEIRARAFAVEPSVRGYLGVMGLECPASDDAKLAYGP
jgi:glycosyltransferase involved in cell wall biosynthesis